MKKTPKGIKITSVNEVTYEVEDDSILPKREVKEYWAFDGKFIGSYDPLDEFNLIISD